MDAQRIRDTAQEALALLLSASCPGCDAHGVLLCDACRGQLVAVPQQLTTPAGLSVTAALPYEGVPARAIRRLKEDGMTSLARPLGAALAAVLGDVGDAVLVPVPTGRAAFRRRGYRVPELLVRRAGHMPCRLLVPTRVTHDQRGLSREARARNVAGSMRARGRASGCDRVLIVDDVVTTGATLDDAARALRAAGCDPIRAVVLAATARQRDTRKFMVNE